MRLFVAVDVPEHLKEAIEADIVEPLREGLPGARWTRPDGRHLTLKFLGNVEDVREVEISEVVRTVASRHGPFEASFSDLGAFPRVLWIGVGVGNDPMFEIAGDLERSLEPLGFEPKDRAFRGHLTLARFRKPLRTGVPELDVPTEPFGVNELVLFESKGGRYTARQRFKLSG